MIILWFMMFAVAMGVILLKRKLQPYIATQNKITPQEDMISITSVMGLDEENDEQIDENDSEDIKTKPLKVEIKSSGLDTSKIKEYIGEQIKKFEFRPRNFQEFISQEQSKEQGRTIIKKVARGIKGHLFLSARQGMGKTTFVQLLANELNAKLITRVGKQLDDPDALIEVINEINTSKEKNVIWFLDECDSMDKKMVKMLNPIIEQFEISGKKIKQFVFACASINKDIWIKNNPDTLDRISHSLHFTNYSAENINTILTQYKNQLYPNDKVSEEILTLISKSCKFCPRIGINLLEDFIVEQDMEKVLRNRRIVKDGLDETDIKILNVLNQATRAMGANATALRAGLSQKQYTTEFEPYLYEMSYINRIPSRVISEKGKKFLKELKK